MKCHDCGTKDYVCVKSKRPDVCDDCMELRLSMVRAMASGQVTPEQVRKTQKAMAGDIFRKGHGSKSMRKALEQANQPIEGE